MKTLKNWKFIKSENNRVDIQCERDVGLHIFVLEEDIFRIAFARDNEFKVPATWAVSPLSLIHI